ncbi:vacuolar protein sorting-associated protein 8 homolog [Anastrepha ludens]|uniref:vacuolar protein sorting-associated protein 8 homolog n=1 Tax=Anastrepha ludens TaxID=28586 RepID=UPI0023B2023F|nr:vacuolar protein sorting-associated protein 8 homolog [Anastrepha ludens]XP_053952629.1 vacuolar protein sorting-associated protein 8 homolog [Anastrepha ludens]XP_053952630.1 vacuolar protein sorting-associated protein 8 homolog [Anastrepha ludens]XP_053952631.1 vacuolar protein sorting-associated protein 8 homolog [Anastrepha ludens]XP_053952633.1 vacuolar protein sorting-associated protein 8 homolog [Anastrepha ludens]XP_053952634.1 vacuolar protein sorting-associated protein 8 homolog [
MNELKAPSLQSLLESDRGSSDSLLAESLLDVEDLDDVEYSIPPTGTLPSLEAVLSEFEADSDIGSELGVPAPTPTPTPSIAEEGGIRNGGAGGGGSIMRYAILQGVSAQTASAADRVNAGLATACAVSSLIGIGTSHGHILNFDITQTLRWAYQDKHGQGAVSALAYNPDCTRLLAGFARGLVIMIDTQSGDVLRNLSDVITPNTGVLHLKWTSRPALALCSDSGGSVWSLSFTRKLGIRGCSSRCLFSGARGEVCTMEPLLMDNSHELDQYCIIALATLSKYFIVTIRPRLKVIKYHALQGPANSLPLLAWQMVLIQAADTTRSVDPVIVVGRGNQLFFHQLFMANGRITLLYLRHVQIQTNLLSVHWLGPKCVACMDVSEILHLIDVRSSKELECIDMANAGLVYGSAQFKGLATGGNVSPALALAGTHACYNSLMSRGTQLYVLGARSLHMIAVRTWTERISYLVKNQRWQEACDLALDGYRATTERPKRKAQAKERIIMLFKEYLAASARAPDYCLGPIVKCLIAIGELDLLWTQLWDRLQNKSLYLKHITEHIENDNIHRVNPTISQALVDHWLEISPSKLEEIILKLDWTCLDLNQVLKAAKRYKLYRAQIYLNAHALNDYSSPLTELIPLVVQESSDLGNALLVYISSCLAGRGYPSGEIPADLVQNVKHEVLRCLTSLHSNTSVPKELPYPYLRALLKFDTRETLNVISLAFQEKEFSGELGFSHRKRIINILLEIMTPENTTWAEIGCLLNFIAQQISQQCLTPDTQLLEKVLNHLSKEEIANETARQHSERESAWHELLVNNCLKEVSNDKEQLHLAKRAHCYYVEEYLLEKLQRYDGIVECYLNNSLRHDIMFSYMERHVRDPQRKIYEQIENNLLRMLEINAKETTRIVDFYYSGQIQKLVEVAENDAHSLLTFLEHLHRRRVDLTAEQSEQLLALLCKHKPKEVEDFVRNTDEYRVEEALKLVLDCKLSRAAIYLHEKQGNYKAAFILSMEVLATMHGEEAAALAQEISNLCVRATDVLTNVECEKFWFKLLQQILPRDDLKSSTKYMLHVASQHVDLPKLVQLVMNTHNVSGNFGDIKDLLMSMLSQSRLETDAMEKTLKNKGQDLASTFAHKRREVTRGLLVSVMRCVMCQQRLYNQSDILVLGGCGHAFHDKCAATYSETLQVNLNDKSLQSTHAENDGCMINYSCPNCLSAIENNFYSNAIKLSEPSHKVYELSKGAHNLHQQQEQILQMGILRLKAPPRKFTSN